MAASLAAEQALEHRLRQLWHGISCPSANGNLPGLGVKPMPPALAGRVPMTGPPGKSPLSVLLAAISLVASTVPGTQEELRNVC